MGGGVSFSEAKPWSASPVKICLGHLKATVFGSQLTSVTPSHAVRGRNRGVNGSVSGEWQVWLFQGLGFLAICLFVCGWDLLVVVLSEFLLVWC